MAHWPHLGGYLGDLGEGTVAAVVRHLVSPPLRLTMVGGRVVGGDRLLVR